MTFNLSDTVRNQFATMRHLYAGAIHEQLRSCRVVDDLSYDGQHIVTAWCDAPHGVSQVDLYVAAEGVQVTFYNPEPIRSTAVIAAPYTISAVVKVVEGLLMATRPCPDSSTTDGEGMRS